ncbi:DUF4282 domain-containing protein [Microbacterium sp. LRZ72]|uniref:DUF4282 domain-containing protein n=1 Tax=Microbacterium sp. LRZ72 TaxID=2942481 RepID=UPI0029B11F34|nr:DUF4282 domain-containing protein [Microbacterium sp. LRZ72]MDX2377368.1 DUF4282 domain-containing protein [Microbacterium sp. LRZ72]
MSDQTPPPPPPPPAGPPPREPEPDHPQPTTSAQHAGASTGMSGSSFSSGFFKALFDVSFRSFITRRLATVFYIAGLVVIALGFLLYFFGGLITAFASMRFDVGSGILLLLGTLIITPIVTFLAVIVLRFWIEAIVALIAIAENTQRTAEHTRRP